MDYLRLKDIRGQVNQDSDIDDAELLRMGGAVEVMTANHLGCPLSELAGSDGSLPLALYQAMLMIVATLYDNRESVTFAQSHGLAAYEALIGPYRRY